MLIRRTPRSRPDRFLEAKLVLFFVGAIVLVIGMAFGRDLLVGIAVAVLLAGIVLRFVDREPPPPMYFEEEEEDGEGDPPEDREPREG